MRFLILDDSKAMRSLVRVHLGSMGYTDIEDASDVRTALVIALADPKPDVCLIDWQMANEGEHDGLAFVKAIRPKLPSSILIMMTAERDKKKTVAAVMAGVDGFVLKPFTPQSFKELIGGAIQRGRAIKQAG